MISKSLIQLSKGQDFIFTHECDDYKIMALFDGHGSSKVINFISDIAKTGELLSILLSDKPIHNLARLIDENANVLPFESSGSTMCLVRIYPTYFECQSIGDSRIIGFIDDKLAFMNEVHDATNSKELERLKKNHRFSIHESKTSFIVTDSNTLNASSSLYINFRNHNRKLQPTQLLGHCSLTGLDPWYYSSADMTAASSVLAEPSIFLFSDGVEDMLSEKELTELYQFKSAEELSQFVEKRWKQEWIFKDGEKIIDKCSFNNPEHWDDISVILFRNCI